MTLFQPYPVSSGSVRGAAEQSTKGIPAIKGLEAGVESDHKAALQAVKGDLAPYVGKAAEPASRWSKTVVARVSFAGGALNLFAIAIDNFNTNSTEPRSVSKLNAAYEEAAANQFGVDVSDYTEDDAGGPTIDARRYSGAVNAAKAALIADLKAEFGRLDERLDAAAAEVAAMLKGKDPRPEDVKAMYAAGALPSYAAMLFPNVDLSKTKLTRLPTDLYGLSHEQIAAYLAKNPGTYNLIAGKLRTFVPGLEDKVGREIANQLRNAKLEGDGSAEALRRYESLLKSWQETSLGVTAAIYENLGAKDTLGFLNRLNDIVDGRVADASALAKVFRHGLGLADMMWDDRQSAAFGRELGQVLRDDLVNNKAAVAFLLDHQRYTTQLLDPLADEIARLDTSPGVLDVNIPSDRVLSGSANVVQSLFSALGQNGEASLNFFDDTAHQEKYLRDRVPSGDGWYGDLLAALDSATTAEVNLGDEERAEAAAKLVSSLGHYLGGEEQGKHFYGNPYAEAGASHLAHILSTYMPAVDYYVGPDGSDETGNQANEVAGIEVPGLGFLRSMPVFEKSELANLVKVAVSTQSGFEEMREGVSTYQNLALQTAVENKADLQAVANADGRLEGFFLRQVADVDIADAASRDAQVQAWIDLGKGLTGAVPMGGKVTSLLGGQALDLASGEVSDALAHQKEGLIEQLKNQTVPETFGTRKYAMAETLYESGAITQEQLEALAAEPAAGGKPWASQEQVERWFDDGFPSPKEIESDRGLKNFLNSALSGEHGIIDLDTYELMYKSQLVEPFAGR